MARPWKGAAHGVDAVLCYAEVLDVGRVDDLVGDGGGYHVYGSLWLYWPDNTVWEPFKKGILPVELSVAI